jgi:hypothetical protein
VKSLFREFLRRSAQCGGAARQLLPRSTRGGQEHRGAAEDDDRLDLDTTVLVDQVLELGPAGRPVLAFNALTTETDRSEHCGLMIKGIFTPSATSQPTTDLLTTISLLHRKLASAVFLRNL